MGRQVVDFDLLSVLPVARKTFCWPLWSGTEGGERARQRMAEAWALKRKVSANSALGFVGFSAFCLDFLDDDDEGEVEGRIVVVMP